MGEQRAGLCREPRAGQGPAGRPPRRPSFERRAVTTSVRRPGPADPEDPSAPPPSGQATPPHTNRRSSAQVTAAVDVRATGRPRQRHPRAARDVEHPARRRHDPRIAGRRQSPGVRPVECGRVGQRSPRRGRRVEHPAVRAPPAPVVHLARRRTNRASAFTTSPGRSDPRGPPPAPASPAARVQPPGDRVERPPRVRATARRCSAVRRGPRRTGSRRPSCATIERSNDGPSGSSGSGPPGVRGRVETAGRGRPRARRCRGRRRHCRRARRGRDHAIRAVGQRQSLQAIGR